MKKLLLYTIIALSANIVNAQWQEPSPVASNSQNVYALASDGTNIFAGAGSAGVALSTNNGGSWTAVNNGLTCTGIGALAISGTNIFAGCDSGVFLSTNNGGLWTAVSNGLPKTNVEALAISGTNIFAGTHNYGVYLSTNNGTLWAAANTGFTGQVVALALSETNIFAGAPNHGVYLSGNNGGNWTAVNNGLANIDVHTIAISGANIFAGTSGGVFLSTNNGGLWTAMNNGLANINVHSILISGINIFAGTDNGVFYSNNNGSSWTAISDGFPENTTVWTLAICGTNIFAGILLYPRGVWTRPLSQVISGLAEKRDNNSFNLFPNPASDMLTLNINNVNNEGVELNIYNVMGVLLRSEMLKQNQRQINIGDLSNGIYMVEIKSKEFTEKQKLIIQR